MPTIAAGRRWLADRNGTIFIDRAEPPRRRTTRPTSRAAALPRHEPLGPIPRRHHRRRRHPAALQAVRCYSPAAPPPTGCHVRPVAIDYGAAARDRLARPAKTGARSNVADASSAGKAAR